MIAELLQWHVLDQLIAAVLTLTSLGAAFLVTYRAGYLNLAISAQLIAGSVIVCTVEHIIGSLVIASACAFVTIYVVGAIPMVLRVLAGVDEVLSTLMLLFLSLPITQYCLAWAMGDESNSVSSLEVGVYSGAFVAGSNWITWAHLAVIPLVLGAALGISYWPVGFRARAMRWREHLFGRKDTLSVLLKLNGLASALMLVVVLSETVFVWRKYTPPALFEQGFEAVAVALVALLRFAFLIPAALVVASVATVFVYASIEYGWPEAGKLLLTGLFLIAAAILVGKARRSE